MRWSLDIVERGIDQWAEAGMGYFWFLQEQISAGTTLGGVGGSRVVRARIEAFEARMGAVASRTFPPIARTTTLRPRLTIRYCGVAAIEPVRHSQETLDLAA